MGKHTNVHYTCRKCLSEFYLDEKPRKCPNCGCPEHHMYQGTIESYRNCQQKIDKVKELIPQMESLMGQYYKLYEEYAWYQKMLTTYVSRV